MSKKRIRASNLLLVHRRRIEKGLIHSQFAEPGAFEPRWDSGRSAASVGQHVFGNRIVRADYFLFRHLGEDSFLLHLSDHLIDAVIG